MESHDARVDAYIAKSAEFARPILEYIRETVHSSSPDIEETIKWGMPHFMYRGGILCNMAAFKQHCALHFWKGSLVVDGDHAAGKPAMGQFGRIAKPSDLPSKATLNRYIKRAMKLKDQ
jgi:hypothetical protein